jgi:hypothetical protein
MVTKEDVDFYLKISEIFAVISVGFGAMTLSMMSLGSQTHFNIYYMLTRLLDKKNITDILPEEILIVKSSINQSEIYAKLLIPFTYIFLLFFASSISSIIYAWILKWKLKTEII